MNEMDAPSQAIFRRGFALRLTRCIQSLLLVLPLYWIVGGRHGEGFEPQDEE